jgi:hypothetical protein
MGAEANATTLNSTYSTTAAPLYVKTGEDETKVDVYLNIDGEKLKMIMEKNTVQNFENYLLREGGL